MVVGTIRTLRNQFLLRNLFERQISSIINIGIGIIGTDKKFRQRKWGYTNETKWDDIISLLHVVDSKRAPLRLPPNAVTSIIDGLKRLRTVILLLNPWSFGSIFNWKDKFYKHLLKCSYTGSFFCAFCGVR
ncbi:hypothetical protein CMV_010361 [Castanea mollissima]|uniref:Uncharacterized protein n=1 Tax=Castanea mollissima TaxID=60419 RepID=A0A8J4R444_9ROSI|nr:hypothetical protein CMV_010361 [Castanea mollissima]